MKKKLTLGNYASIVPDQDIESIQLVLGEIHETIFPFVLVVLYDDESGLYDIVWEAEKDGKGDDEIAEEMTIDELLVAQYTLCMAFEKYAEKTAHSNLDKKYIEAVENASKKTSDIDNIEVFDAFGMKVVNQMPCMFMRQNSKGHVYGLDKGIVVGVTDKFVMIAPDNKEMYRNFETGEFRIIYRKPHRIICGAVFDPTRKTPCQVREEKEARRKAAEKYMAGEQLDKEEQKLYDEYIGRGEFEEDADK
jgi:hypothetical protein